jgi:hypothetical protein
MAHRILLTCCTLAKPARSACGDVDAPVVDDKEHPVPGVSVAAVPAPSGRNRTDLYHLTPTDAMGHAHLQGLAPGSSKLFASDGVSRNAWEDPT